MDITSDDIIGSSYRGSNSGGGEGVMGWSVEEEVVLGGLTRVLGGCEGVEVQRGVEVTEVIRPQPQVGSLVSNVLCICNACLNSFHFVTTCIAYTC